MSYALVTYRFDDVPQHKVLVCPHGNAIRNKRPFRRTREITKKLLQSELEKNCDAKEAVKKVFDKRGGVLSAQSIATKQKSSLQYKKDIGAKENGCLSWR